MPELKNAFNKGSFLRAKDAKEDEIVTFVDSGQWRENSRYPNSDGSPKKEFTINVKYLGEVKTVKINGMSFEKLSQEFGSNSDDWVNKQASILILPTPNGEHKMLVLKPVRRVSEEKGWDD